MSEKPVRIPAEAFHLSTMLQDELEARGWHLPDLARRMGSESEYKLNLCTLELIWAVHDASCRAGDESLKKMAAAFGFSFEYLKNLENAWHDWMKHHGLTQQIPPREVADEVERDVHPTNDNSPPQDKP